MTGEPLQIIGLSGGIGAGKSSVATILADGGCLVVDSDALGRKALEDPAVRRELVSWWGPEILDGDGRVNRSAVATIVFSRLEERHRLEALVHPWIETRRRTAFADAPLGTTALVIDAPLLVETGLDEICDAVIYVDVPRAVRLERVSHTRGWDAAELARREDSQVPLDEKRSRSDHVISNTGDLDQLADEVRQVLRTIIRPT